MMPTPAPSPRMRDFASPAELAGELAAIVADKLRDAVGKRGRAVMAVSGGSTPALFFERLSEQPLDWHKVAVTLVDERFVPPSSDRSNERLVRSTLLQNAAGAARFAGLYSPTATVEEAASAADAGIAPLGQPFDVVVLGMGADGHTASFFSDAANIAALTDPRSRRRVLAVHAASGAEARMTLTLPLIANARFIALHIEGDDKKAVLDRALSDPDPKMPIRTVFDHAASPVHVFRAPSQGATK